MSREEQIAAIKAWLGTGSINLFGLPFSGKDSQGRRLVATFGGTVLSSGEIFRNSTDRISPRVKAMLDNGELAPTEDFIDIVLPYLQRDEFKGHPLILSSVGRWSGEEEGVMGALEASNHPLRAVIYLRLDDDVAFERHDESEHADDEDAKSRSGRSDHGRDKLATRIKEFNEKTLPVVDFYRQRGLVIDIDASAPKDAVESQILEALAQRSIA